MTALSVIFLLNVAGAVTTGAITGRSLRKGPTDHNSFFQLSHPTTSCDPVLYQIMQDFLPEKNRNLEFPALIFLDKNTKIKVVISYLFKRLSNVFVTILNSTSVPYYNFS